MEHVETGFSYSLSLFDGRILIKSTCLKCGESKVVSRGDGSLLEWEQRHIAQHNPVEIGCPSAQSHTVSPWPWIVPHPRHEDELLPAH
jgi:hypothetical protein